MTQHTLSVKSAGNGNYCGRARGTSREYVVGMFVFLTCHIFVFTPSPNIHPVTLHSDQFYSRNDKVHRREMLHECKIAGIMRLVGGRKFHEFR